MAWLCWINGSLQRAQCGWIRAPQLGRGGTTSSYLGGHRLGGEVIFGKVKNVPFFSYRKPVWISAEFPRHPLFVLKCVCVGGGVPEDTHFGFCGAVHPTWMGEKHEGKGSFQK